MTTEPDPPDESGWTQVPTTPKRGGGGDKSNEEGQKEMNTEKWRAEFIVNRADRGKQWLVDVAMVNLMTVFFQQDCNTVVICRNKTEIKDTEQLKKAINKGASNVLQTTETKNRKIVVFEINYPIGLHAAKRDPQVMQHLKDHKVFINKHTTTEMIFEQVGFFIELDPATAFRPDIERDLHRKIRHHITEFPNDGRDAFASKDTEVNVPYFELRKGIEAQEHKLNEDDEEKILVKTEVLQVWTEAGSAEKLRMLLSKMDLRTSYMGQFLPKKRGTKLYSVEKYINAIQRQIKYKSEISSIMIQYLAEEVMLADVNEVYLDDDIEPMDTHILAIPNVLRIEPTNDTTTKGKWLVICKKEHREDIRTRLINNLSWYYKKSTAYEQVATKFHSPVPVVAPARYDYAGYVESIIPENMILGMEDHKDKSTTNINKRRRTMKIGNVKTIPIATITTTAKHEIGIVTTPYLNAAKGNKANHESTNRGRNNDDPTTNKSCNTTGSSLKSNDSAAFSALTTKVDSISSQLTAARREIAESKKIIAALLQENKEIKERQQKNDEINNQTQLMFQQLMLNINPHQISTQVTVHSSGPPQPENMNTTPEKYQATSLQQATEHDIRNPPNMKPVKLKFNLSERRKTELEAGEGNEIVFTKDKEMELWESNISTKKTTPTTTNSTSSSYGLGDDE